MTPDAGLARGLSRRVRLLIAGVLAALIAMAMLVVVNSPAHAYTQADRNEQIRYANETINLTYSAFIARKADFARAGCRIENYENNGFPYPGCRKPSPYNAFNWTDDGCSGRGEGWLGIGTPVSNLYRNLFNEPCQLHDFGYRNFGKGLTLARNEEMRAWIDGRFRDEMFRLCNTTRSGNLSALRDCRLTAVAMWTYLRKRGEDWNTLPETPPAPVNPTPTPEGCAFVDAGNGAVISAARRSTFTDSRGITYRVGSDCGLTRLTTTIPNCEFMDAGNGQPITAARGTTFTDSRGITYRVGLECSLTEADCEYRDAANGGPIGVARGSTFTDSRGITYRVGTDCGLTELPETNPGCEYKDAGNGRPISAARGTTFTDSRGLTYRVGNDCGLIPTPQPGENSPTDEPSDEEVEPPAEDDPAEDASPTPGEVGPDEDGS